MRPVKRCLSCSHKEWWSWCYPQCSCTNHSTLATYLQHQQWRHRLHGVLLVNVFTEPIRDTSFKHGLSQRDIAVLKWLLCCKLYTYITVMLLWPKACRFGWRLDNKSTKRCISGCSSNMLAYLRISLVHHQSGHSCWRHAELERCCRLAVGSHYQYTVHHPVLFVHLPGQSRHWAAPVQLKTWIICLFMNAMFHKKVSRGY